MLLVRQGLMLPLCQGKGLSLLACLRLTNLRPLVCRGGASRLPLWWQANHRKARSCWWGLG